MVNVALLGRVAAHHGQVGLGHFLAFELAAQVAGTVLVQRKDQHAGGASVEPVGGVDVTTELVAQQLHGKAGFVTIQLATVNQQAGGLVDDDHVVVLIEDGQHGRNGNRGWC
jgi:hypothetical protein